MHIARPVEQVIIDYLSEPVEEWNRILDNAADLFSLRKMIEPYKRIANDAVKIVAKWTDQDFADFRVALKKERRGKFSGEDSAQRFAVVIMPEVMIQVSLIAGHFKAPWGAAFIQLKNAGRIKENSGIATWVDKP